MAYMLVGYIKTKKVIDGQVIPNQLAFCVV